MKTDDSFSLKEKVDDTDKKIAGKKDDDSKKQFTSPELVDEKENINKTELPNFELNLLLQKSQSLTFKDQSNGKHFCFLLR